MNVEQAIRNRQVELKSIEEDLGFATIAKNADDIAQLKVSRHLKIIEIEHLQADLV